MGKACTFFGHRDCPDTIKEKLRSVLIELIENHAVDLFYVGRQGAFDALARAVLRELAQKYPYVRYAVVLERVPTGSSHSSTFDYSDTLLPDGIEAVHPRYAIPFRNNWMLAQSDYVVTYITHTWGGAAQFAAKAIRQGKDVIDVTAYLKE